MLYEAKKPQNNLIIKQQQRKEQNSSRAIKKNYTFVLSFGYPIKVTDYTEEARE
jgi:hypothetical protein